jgi:hypothetical protein
MRRVIRLGLLLITLTAALSMAEAAQATLAPPGWALGGDGLGTTQASAQSQVDADQQTAASTCFSNSALLFRVRGSGDGYGNNDHLGGWALAAGSRLIAKGWNVRDMQAIYDAPSVPFSLIWSDLVTASQANVLLRPAAFLVAIAKIPGRFKVYRDVASSQWSAVRDQLTSAAARCAQRKIFIAGYSQGNIILRYVLGGANLAQQVRDQIAHVDLVADPTADGRTDVNMPHSATGISRLTKEGIDTFVAEATHGGFFQQTAFPDDVASRTTQLCRSYDLVCEANPVNFTKVMSEGTNHAGYSWSSIGRATANLPSIPTIKPEKPPKPPKPVTIFRPSFTVMNTSETPPDGVWFRNSPHTADTDRVTGHGVYVHERVRLECFGWGDAVGAYNDTLWYQTTNLTRPTNAGVANIGWLNAHYVNDGKLANQVVTGVPQC